MAKTGKGLPRSLQNVDFGDFDIPVAPATTSVVVTGGLEPYSYQWYKNNNAIAGATAATYAKASTTTADSGTYKVVVHDVYGNIISSSTVATVS